MILRNQSERIRIARDVLGLSQQAFASALYTTQATVSRWENRGSIHAASMVRIEDLLRAQERLHHIPPLLRLEAATLARAVLAAATPARLDECARRVLSIVERQLTRSTDL